MEREELISKISEKVGRTNVTEQTIGNFVDSFPLPEGTEPDEEYITNVATFFGKTVSGNISLEAANAVKPLNEQIATLTTQIAELKKQKPSQTKNEELQKMMQTLDDLKEKFESIDKKQAQQQLKEQVIQAMKDKKADDEYVLGNTLLKYGEFDTQKSVDEIVAELIKKYDSEYSACRGAGAIPRSSGNTGGGKNSEAFKRAREDYKQRLIKAGKLPKPQV